MASHAIQPAHFLVLRTRPQERQRGTPELGVVPETGPGRDILSARRRAALWHAAGDLAPDCRRANVGPGYCVGGGSDGLRAEDSPCYRVCGSRRLLRKRRRASNRASVVTTAHCWPPALTRGGAFAAAVMAAATDIVFQKRDHG
jgi:hypothetical protein